MRAILTLWKKSEALIWSSKSSPRSHILRPQIWPSKALFNFFSKMVGTLCSIYLFFNTWQIFKTSFQPHIAFVYLLKYNIYHRQVKFRARQFFTCLCVILFTERGDPSMHLGRMSVDRGRGCSQTGCGQGVYTLPWHTPWDGNWSGWYPSYWNAFLYQLISVFHMNNVQCSYLV